MNRKWFSIIILVATAICLCSVSSCGFNQHLTSIQVLPPSATFGGVGAAIQFKALGTYDHPPATKDITATVNWSTGERRHLARIALQAERPYETPFEESEK